MCGISGFVDLKSELAEEQLLVYNRILHKRGPDGTGTFLDKTDYGHVGLAHVRLSILDLSSLGKQPMFFENLTIILNGEIYNFKSIQKDLINLGYSFVSNSDTEVVLKAFHAWGLSSVDRFRGMFAFAIYDKKVNKVYLCRDRVGIKPLYYYLDNQKFIFGSELKVFFNTASFNPEVNLDSLKTFINYGYVTHPQTMLTNVFKADVGSWTIFNIPSFKLEVKKYWDYAKIYENEKFNGSFEDAVSKTEELVQEACELRMVSDVPVGVFLSGGFDSTLVTSVLQKDRTEKLKTFTIGFSDGVDESGDALKIAKHLGTDHTSYDCQQKDAMDLIPDLPDLYDDPIADISCIPTMLVSKLARQEVTVALSADGGDELFGGYGGFKAVPELFSNLEKIPFQSITGNILKSIAPLFSGKYNHLEKKLKGIGNILNVSKENRIYQNHLHQSSLPSVILDKLFLKNAIIHQPIRNKVYMKDSLDELFILGVDDVLRDLLLVKVDRATMGYSLEGREPLLDHVLMEYAASLPYHYKHNGVDSKRPIREIVYKYVPKEIMDRPKIGFDLPIYKWLKKDLAYLMDEFLSDYALKKSNVFNVQYVNKLIVDFKNNRLRYNPLIWRLLVFQMWHKRWLNQRNHSLQN